MKKVYLLSFVVLLIMLLSCNKKNNNTTSPSTPSTSSPTTLVPDSFNGLFTTELAYTLTSASTTSLNYNFNTYAVVTNSLITNFMIPISGPFVNLDTVWLNGNKLSKGTMSFPNENIYFDVSSGFVNGPYAWKTLGGAMPAFTYTNTNSYCTFTGHSSWPDTITKSNGLSVSLSGVANASEAWIYLSNYPAGPITSSVNVLLGSASSYSFSPASLSSLSTASTGIITVSFYRNNIQTIAGKKINFRNVTTFVKYTGMKN